MQILVKFLDRFPARTRNLITTCFYGIAAGGIAVGFQLSIQAVFNFTYGHLTALPTWGFLLGSALVLVGTSMAVGWLLSRFEPAAAGSGIPQMKLAFWRDFGFIRWRVVVVKFIAGVLSIGGGASLGREGPSVQLAGGLASNLAGLAGEAKQNRRQAAAAGSAAGLAAAFNTPLAAVTFVLEEIIGDLNSRLLGGVLLASVLGAFVVQGIMGSHPAFAVGKMDQPAWSLYVVVPLAAAFAAQLGVWFQQSTLALRGRLRGMRQFPAWARPVVGGVVTWALGAAVFLKVHHTGVYGLGYADLESALSNDLTWKVALVLLVAKFVATVACYGSGGCGGIFAPTLGLGAMSGLVMAALAHNVLPMSPSDQTALALVGMSAFLGAVVRAPITGILIVFEMTHDFALVPALMLAALISQTLSRWQLTHGFYDALLEQDGVQLDRSMPPRDLRSWLSWPVVAIANAKPVAVTDYSAESLRALLEQYPYSRFPAMRHGNLEGIILRTEIEKALVEQREPRPESASTCAVGKSIRETQELLVSSSSGMVLLVDRGQVVGLVTLHDLLRAQSNVAGDY